MVTRILTNAGAPLLFPDGSPAARIKIGFTLVRNSGDADDVFDSITGERVAPGPIIATTDDSGVFSVSLWPTSRGDAQTFYNCIVPLPGVKGIIAPLPDGAGDYSWIQFKLGATGPSAPPWLPTPLEMYDVSAWPSLADAIADPATFGKTLWISTVVSCGTIDTSGRDIRVLLGGQINVDHGEVATIPLFSAGEYQVFAGAGAVVFSNSRKEPVLFDWFDHEKASQAQYDAFINGTAATYGAIPAITSKNRATLTMLLAGGYSVKFCTGIYPFDAEVPLTGNFKITGIDRNSTLLWCPNSSFLHFYTGGATYPYIKDIAIEANNSVIRTQANTVNSIHGLILKDSFFISYADHAFMNDYSTAGGTGCPIYGSKIVNCAVYAGPAKGCFYGWGSDSNIYDNVVDLHVFYNGISTNKKGIARSLFYNSNVKLYCNSNITYSGLEYVYFADRPSALNTFTAKDNVFENNTYGFMAIVKVTQSTSNLNLETSSNTYAGTPSENGYHYLLQCGNTNLTGTDSPTPLYGNTVRNQSNDYVCAVTTKTDSGATKYRLAYYEPQSSFEGVNSAAVLITPTSALAELVGMKSIYDADSANISYIQVARSRHAINSAVLGTNGSGTTAQRPTYGLYPGYPYFDTTLGYMVWYSGTVWKNASGTTV